MKRFVSLMLVMLVLMLSSSFAFAQTTPSQSTSGSTEYTPKDSKASVTSDASTMATGFGVIVCDSEGDTAYCNWTVTASDDLISYSAIWVIYEKWNSSTGKWTTVDTDRFEYTVNPPTKSIQNQSVFIDEPGLYRAKLGGTFTGVYNGVYVASANDPSVFNLE